MTCTHVVADEYDSEDVQSALKDDKRCVTIMWLDWALETRRMRPPRCLLHIPLPASGRTVIKDRFRVSISHFPPKTNEYVKAGLARLGVTTTKMLYKVILWLKKRNEKHHEKSEKNCHFFIFWQFLFLLAVDQFGTDLALEFLFVPQFRFLS